MLVLHEVEVPVPAIQYENTWSDEHVYGMVEDNAKDDQHSRFLLFFFFIGIDWDRLGLMFRLAEFESLASDRHDTAPVSSSCDDDACGTR